MARRFNLTAACAWLLALCAATLHAEKISIPNSSFESPAISFVTVNIDSWQKTPKPDWYQESGTFLWSYNIGGFKNTATNTSNYIDNMDGNQAIWLFAVPEVTLYQDYESIDYNDPTPTHEFDAKFEPGKSYHLTVGVIGTGGGMLPGATLDLSLYYRDAASNRIAVATTSLTNDPAVFSNSTHFVDCWVHVPVVQPTDFWAGKNIGIQFVSTVSSNLQGGYWDLDNVRLSSGPSLSNIVITNGHPQFSLLGEPGRTFEIISSPVLTEPLPNWTSVSFLTNVSGMATITAPATQAERTFYRARQLP